jgi:integrase
MRLPILTFVYDRKHKGSSEKEVPVELRITLDRKQKYITTGVRILPNQWHHNCVVNRFDAMEMNRTLELILADARKVINDMMQENCCNLEGIPGRLRRAQEGEKSFIEFANERAEVRKYGRTKDSQERYNRFMRFFEGWGKIKYFSDITDQSILMMDEELKKKGMKPYSKWNNYHRFMNSFILDAIDEGYLKRNPYKWLHIEKDKESKSINKYLTKEEFTRLKNIELPTLCLEKIRDLFVFQTYTCLSYIDLKTFDYKKAHEDDKGRLMYVGHRGKTHQEYTFLVLQPAFEILKKYHYHLPVISNVKYNEYLKVVAMMAKIDKPVSSHWARHTGATMLLNDGIDMEVVAKILGHSTTRITRKIYAKLLDETVADSMSHLDAGLK